MPATPRFQQVLRPAPPAPKAPPTAIPWRGQPDKIVYSKWDIRRISLERLGFKTYGDYLKSALWKGIRKRVLTRDKNKCKDCGDRAIQVHHEQYDPYTMAGKDLQHLRSVCDRCHCVIEANRKVKETEARWHKQARKPVRMKTIRVKFRRLRA